MSCFQLAKCQQDLFASEERSTKQSIENKQLKQSLDRSQALEAKANLDCKGWILSLYSDIYSSIYAFMHVGVRLLLLL